MSAVGTKRTFQPDPRLSAIGQERTMVGTGAEWLDRELNFFGKKNSFGGVEAGGTLEAKSLVIPWNNSLSHFYVSP